MAREEAPLHKRLAARTDFLDSQRRAEVLDAASAWFSARTGASRLRGSVWPITQTALAAGLAWIVASRLLGHPAPFFAPVAAIMVLGVTRGQRARRAIELLFGVSLGVGLADIALHATGRGVLALMLAVALAMVAAIVLKAGQLTLSE